MEARVWCGGLLVLLALVSMLSVTPAVADEIEKVLTWDHSNFSDIVSKRNFIFVELYAPWCGHCKSLAPAYEKSASILSNKAHPIFVAKVDANEEANKGLVSKFEIQDFTIITILRNGGKNIQDYKSPREDAGIMEFLKKQVDHASTHIKSVEDVAGLIDNKKLSIIGVFQKLSGKEYENFLSLAEKLRSDYDFGYTLDAKLLPKEESVSKPTLRLFNLNHIMGNNGPDMMGQAAYQFGDEHFATQESQVDTAGTIFDNQNSLIGPGEQARNGGWEMNMAEQQHHSRGASEMQGVRIEATDKDAWSGAPKSVRDWDKAKGFVAWGDSHDRQK